MKLKDLNGRMMEVEISRCDYDEIYVDSATYCDDGSEVPESVLMWIQDHYAEEIFQEACERFQAYVESMEDR